MIATTERLRPAQRGVLTCNRVDCRKPLNGRARSFCPLTNAYYCADCAERINRMCGPGTCKPVQNPRT